MKGSRIIGIIMMLAILLPLVAGMGQAQETSPEGESIQADLGTSFTYQGRLNHDGIPVSATCSFQLSLWDALTGGSQVGTTQTKSGVVVNDGYFTVDLDFGTDAFNGEARYLEISVDCGSGYSALSPRVTLNPAPHALALPGLRTQQNIDSPNIIGGYVGNSVTSGVYGATIGGGGASLLVNRVADDHGTVAGGENNQAGNNDGDTGWSSWATVGGGLSNTASNQGSTVGGGMQNTASGLISAVGGGYHNLASGLDATISGGYYNTASGQVVTVGGGRFNTASGYGAMVPGGDSNLAQGNWSFAAGRQAKANSAGCFVWADSIEADFACNTANQFAVRATGGVAMRVDTSLGGLHLEPDATSPNLIAGHGGNTVTGGAHGATIGGGGSGGWANSVTDHYGTVGGGEGNRAGDDDGTAGDRPYATVGGGLGNTAGNSYATVGGGSENIAGGEGATVPGGSLNVADGAFSFAAGRRAQALHDGAFVWADFSDDTDWASTDVNQFAVRAHGGAVFDLAGQPFLIDGNHVWHAGNDGPGSGLDADLLDGQHGSAYYVQGGNSFGTVGTLGTNDAYALELEVNNSRALRLEPDATSPNLIGGYSGNTVTAGVYGATIGGGGTGALLNRVTDTYGAVGGGLANEAGNDAVTVYDASYATVGGGFSNNAGGQYATVGGGWSNDATGEGAAILGGELNTASARETFVGGGEANQATVERAVVAGGYNNTASGGAAAVGGGESNTASGSYSVVPGGSGNTASGDFALAAGHRAWAVYPGCFVWGDASEDDISCDDENSTTFRSTGGFYIYTSSDLSSGVYLAPGGSSWDVVSDRARKENFEPVDTQALLVRLAQIPMSTWNYRSQDASIRHIGPMADDFNGLVDGLGGEGEDRINSLDADGVALAAIQGLAQRAQAYDAGIAELEARVTALEQQNAALEARLAALEAGANGDGSTPASANRWPGLGAGLVLVGLAGGVVVRRRGGGR